MSVKNAYDKWAGTYDQDINRTRDTDERVTTRLLEGLENKLSLELGCGTGKNTKHLLKVSKSVKAIDFSAEMIAVAKSKIVSQNVEFIHADITKTLPLEDESRDLAICNLVLEHIEQLGAVFQEVSRVLQPGSKFIVSELHPFRQYQGTTARFMNGEVETPIHAYQHEISDFFNAATKADFALIKIMEWRHEDDAGKPPRLLTMVFEKN
jgi:malonyl-CoA O-methyltransferase